MKSGSVVAAVLCAVLMNTPIVGQGGPGGAPTAGRQGGAPPAPGAGIGTGADISGVWSWGGHQDFGLGTSSGSLVDYGGFPFSEAGRLTALAWSASRMTVRQHQCESYSIPYEFISPGNYRFWEERDPVTQRLIAIKMYFQNTEGNRTIWMDGRPHPPAYAPHTFFGYSTGRYDGNALTVTTTHLKRGTLRANGSSQSDQTSLVEHFVRHGDRITYFSVSTDPVMMAEPFSKTVILLRHVVTPTAWLFPCDDGEQILGMSQDTVASYFFGQHPFLREYSAAKKVPLLGALGGPETIYPEFRAKLSTATEAEALAKTRPVTGAPLSSRAVDPEPRDGEIHVWPVAGNVYMLAGDGGNIAVQIADQGALVVDTGKGELADKVVAAIRKLTDKPIQFVVNTSVHADHVGGNAKIRAAGADGSLSGTFFSLQFSNTGEGATIIAHQNVQTRLTELGAAAPTPSESFPSDTFVEDRRRKHYNGEAVEIFHQPNASTDGDSIVHFRRSDVIVAGDLFTTTQYPFIDTKNGGTLQGVISALIYILEKTVYKHQQEGGTMVIPGHGYVSDEYDVAEYRDMLVIIRDRVQTMIKEGATLEQVRAARVTTDYDPRYGATTGPWTTDMFVEAVYTSLKNPPRPTARN